MDFKKMDGKEIRLRLGLTLAIASIVGNICCCTWGGVPISIPFAIMGSALAFTARDEDGTLPKITKHIFIYSGIGFTLGVVLYIILLQSVQSLQDPEIAAEWLKMVEELKEQIPGLENLEQFKFKNLF